MKRFYEERASWRNPKEENMRFKKATRLANIPKVKCGNELRLTKVLDIGCRNGSLRKYLDENLIYYGIDLVDTFRTKDISIQDITEGTDFTDGFFDYVFCIDVLEHLKNPFFVLSEINRILKNRGILILSVPNPYHFKEIIWNLFGVEDRQGHMFSWTKQTMQRLAGFCGFCIVEMSGTYLVPSIGCNGLLARSIIYKFFKNGEP